MQGELITDLVGTIVAFQGTDEEKIIRAVVLPNEGSMEFLVQDVKTGQLHVARPYECRIVSLPTPAEGQARPPAPEKTAVKALQEENQAALEALAAQILDLTSTKWNETELMEEATKIIKKWASQQ